VTVVVEEDCVVDLGYRGDEQIDRARPPMLAELRETRLGSKSGFRGALVHWEFPEGVEICRHRKVAARPAYGVEDLELDRRAKDEVIGRQRRLSALGDRDGGRERCRSEDLSSLLRFFARLMTKDVLSFLWLVEDVLLDHPEEAPRLRDPL
jgi:hypothetical protein